MKRFFCVVCKKMKRVQRWPVMIQNVESDTPQDRVGACNRHTNTRSSSALRVARPVSRKMGA
jgi:hypothetical protein